MASLQEFESSLKEVVQAKRLSASKMGKLTDIAMKLMEDDTQLVSILYRTHKTLPPASKVSSLYVFDALSRAARHHVVKHAPSTKSEKGNAATFLFKVEGVLEGLFQDMATLDLPESKEKTKKILDIWAKGNTFPAPVLSRLKEVVKEAEQVSELGSKPADPRATQAAATKASSPSPAPQPAAAAVASLTDPQAALLALLTKAVTAAPQTIPNKEPLPETTQLSILQQLAQTAKLNNEHAANAPYSQNGQFGITPGPSYHDYAPDYNRYPHDHDRRPRGGHRGAFHRGRGRGGDGWKEDRNHGDRFKDWSPRQGSRHSRSKSPPSRYAAAGRRDVKPYSPPRRPSVGQQDEFGRDLRSLSPPTNDEPVQSDLIPPASGLGSVETTPTVASSNHDHPPLSTSIAANTSMSLSPPAPSTTTTTTKDHDQAAGLESFNIASFDFTSPASWESLGKMWLVTNGEMPSTEQLMQFVMSFGAGPAAQQQQQQWGWAGDTEMQTWDNNQYGHGYQGGGGRRRGGGYGNGRDYQHRQWNHTYEKETEAIVLGGGDEQTETSQPQSDSHNSSGGSMQKVGDKWMFVRDPTGGVT